MQMIDKLFEIPVFGKLLKLIFSESFHIKLVYIAALGGLFWLADYFYPLAIFSTISYYLIRIPLYLFGIWMALIFLLLLIEKFTDQYSTFANASKALIAKRLKKAFKNGELELFLSFNSQYLEIIDVHQYNDIFTINVTGGQDDNVNQEIIDLLSDKTDQTFEIKSGDNLWRRIVIVER